MGWATFLIAVAALGGAADPAQESQRRGSVVEVDEGKVYYEKWGAGAKAVVLVVLHSAAWDDVWPEFCKHFHTIR